MVCSVQDCLKPLYNKQRELCSMHYSRLKRHGNLGFTPAQIIMNMSAEERFFYYNWTVKKNGCWEWRGTRDTAGYGVIQVNRKPVKVHRFSYSLRFGLIPEGLHILHRCDNPPCVNPLHLRAGTREENMQDKYDKNRVSRLFGSKNPKAKINQAIANEIRLVYSREDISQSSLARKMGYSLDIIRGVLVEGRWVENDT